MTRFEEKGRQKLLSAATKDDAAHRYAHSCAICCSRGFRIDCDRCGIAATYEDVIEYFKDPEPIIIPVRA